MMPRLVMSALVALAWGCGGSGAPAPSTPAQQAAAPAAAPTTAPAQTVGDSAAQDTMAGRTGLVRELFAYRGAGRDPMQSLLTSGEIRPLLEDLRLTTVV